MRSPPEHLDGVTWDAVNRVFVAKVLSEFAHERLISPEPHSEGKVYTLFADEGMVVYRFRATVRGLDHWGVQEESIEKRRGNIPEPLDAAALILELKGALGIPPGVIGPYLEEINATLAGLAYRYKYQRFDARALAEAEFQDIEASMSAGHPCFVANGGRIGFDEDEYRTFAPETGQTFPLVWLAADRSRAHFASIGGVSYDAFIREELGESLLEAFCARIRSHGRDPKAYLLMPVHPWQWANKLLTAFAGEIAQGHLIYVGEGEDRYQPQQSIRTLFNRSRPERPYVKTSLSILNMGFMRGLSPEYMATTPAINEWVANFIEKDDLLKVRGFAVLREFATVGYRNPTFERGTPAGNAYRKMLSALWRESPGTKTKPRQQLMTMAALLHRDRNGDALLPVLIERSQLKPQAWLRQYLDVYLAPLLHCFYVHQLAFMPHGENVILVLEDGVPVRVFLKDIGEEVLFFDAKERLPRGVRRIALDVPDDVRVLSILTDVFDGFLRFLAHTFAEHTSCGEGEFWRCVAECIHGYQKTQSDFQKDFERFDLFAPAFKRLCLNRMQLENNAQLLDLSNPVASFKYAGDLENPLAEFRRAFGFPTK